MGLGDLFGGGRKAADAKKNAQIQFNAEMDRFQHELATVWENYWYAQDEHAYAVSNAQQEIDFRNGSASNDWIYRESMRRFNYNNEISAYNQSLATYEKQMDYNNLALEITASDNTRKYNERLVAIGLQNEELFMKYGFDVRGKQKEIEKIKSETAFKAQDLAIQALEKRGAIRAGGQSGRSARKNMQASLAAHGRKQAVLADSLLRDEDAYTFGLEKAGSQYNFNKKQLNESTHSAKMQHTFDQVNAALQKHSADLVAESQILPEPMEPPQLPKPLELYPPKIMEPQEPPSWERFKTMVPEKMKVSSPGILETVGNVVDAGLSIYGVAKGFGAFGGGGTDYSKLGGKGWGAFQT